MVKSSEDTPELSGSGMTVMEKVTRWMAETGVSGKYLGDQIGVSQASISGMTTGKTARPGPKILIGLARAMGCRLDWLLDPDTSWPPVNEDQKGDILTGYEKAVLALARDIEETFGPGSAKRRLLGEYTPTQEGPYSLKAASPRAGGAGKKKSNG